MFATRPKLGAGVALAVALLGPPALPALERSDTLRRELTLASRGERSVAIDNVFGPVKVVGGGGDRVTVEIRRRAEARREAALAAAFEEVTLEVDEGGARLELAQDGPFRCERRGPRRDRNRWGGCDWDPDYEVAWEWTVTLPADVALEVSTVNAGDVVVDGVLGPVELANVNGEIRARGLAAAAELTTVNGDVTAEFERVPEGGGSFETVNGEIYSDFEVVAVAERAVVDDERGARGRKTYRLERDAVVRIGAGGPRLDCETLNGDIVVRSR
jgi:hypothetical protein